MHSTTVPLVQQLNWNRNWKHKTVIIAVKCNMSSSSTPLNQLLRATEVTLAAARVDCFLDKWFHFVFSSSNGNSLTYILFFCASKNSVLTSMFGSDNTVNSLMTTRKTQTDLTASTKQEYKACIALRQVEWSVSYIWSTLLLWLCSLFYILTCMAAAGLGPSLAISLQG